MTTTFKKVIVMSAALIVLTWAIFSIVASAAEKELNYDILKHKTQDVSMANDYFNKPAKLIDKNGKQYVQFTVNHSHWIVNFTFNGQKETVVHEDKAKDERTSEFSIDKTSGEIPGTIKVYIDEEVNGKPFKYDHNYNITYLLKGDAQGESAAAKSNADGSKGDVTKGESAGATGKAESSDATPTNPQTGAGESKWLYITLMGASAILLLSFVVYKRKKGQH
ncbi:heme uptake protein IsdC [Staphylococcus simulans]|uniref:heme uptake protein IsdC n=1 Tax=Staphylococcus simulans TaxID=1286 RepID=UPI00399B04B9